MFTLTNTLKTQSKEDAQFPKFFVEEFSNQGNTKNLCVCEHIHMYERLCIEYNKQRLVKLLYCHFYVRLDRWKGFLFR